MPPITCIKEELILEEFIEVRFDDKDKWRVHGFTQIPNCLLICTDLTIQARLLYSIMSMHAMQKDSCYMSQQLLCDEIGIKKPKNISPYLDELINAGLIEKVNRAGTTNIYNIVRLEVYQTPLINKFLRTTLKNKEVHPTRCDPLQGGTPYKVEGDTPYKVEGVHPTRGTNNKKEKQKVKEEKENPSLFKLNNCNIVNTIIDYLNVKAGTHYKPTTRSYIKEITGRLKEGYKLDNFKYVIDVKVAEWKDDKKMRQYLNPETLFRVSNFDRYLNQPMPAKQVSKVQKMEGIDYDELDKLHKIQETSKKSDVVF